MAKTQFENKQTQTTVTMVLTWCLFVFPSLFCQLTKSDELLTKLRYLKSLVAPLVESYWVSACALRWLSNQTFSGKVRKRKLRSKDTNLSSTGGLFISSTFEGGRGGGGGGLNREGGHFHICESGYYTVALYCLFNNQKIVSDPHKELERKVEKLKHMKLEVMQPKIKKVITSCT